MVGKQPLGQALRQTLPGIAGGIRGQRRQRFLPVAERLRPNQSCTERQTTASAENKTLTHQVFGVHSQRGQRLLPPAEQFRANESCMHNGRQCIVAIIMHQQHLQL